MRIHDVGAASITHGWGPGKFEMSLKVWLSMHWVSASAPFATLFLSLSVKAAWAALDIRWHGPRERHVSPHAGVLGQLWPHSWPMHVSSMGRPWPRSRSPLHVRMHVALHMRPIVNCVTTAQTCRVAYWAVVMSFKDPWAPSIHLRGPGAAWKISR